VNLRDSKKQSALGVAALFNNIQVAENLVAQGANVNNVNAKGNTPLMLAAPNHYLEMLSFLVNNGAQKEMQNKAGETAQNRARAPMNGTRKYWTELENEVWELLN